MRKKTTGEKKTTLIIARFPSLASALTPHASALPIFSICPARSKSLVVKPPAL
jgi:hypothetical protein